MPDIASQLQIPNYSANFGQAIQNMGGLMALRGQQLQQQVTGQQLGANLAASQAVQQSIDPTTGQIDPAKFAASMSQTPYAYNTAQYLTQIQQARNAQIQTETNQLALRHQTLSAITGQLAPLVQLGEQATPQQIAQAFGNSVSLGGAPLNQTMQVLSQMPQDAKQRAAWLKNLYVGSMNAKDQIGLVFPSAGPTINTGGSQYTTTYNPMTGQTTPNASYANSLTPGEAAARIPTVGPNGTPGTIPLGATVPGMAPPAMQQGMQQGAYTGRYPQAAQAPGQMPGAPAGFVPTGLSPAAQTASTQQGADSQKLLSSDEARVNDSATRIYQLQQGLQNLQTADTGPGSPWINTVKSFLQAHGGALSPLLPGDPAKIQSYDEANKYLTQYALNQAANFGAGTDQQLATTLAASPSTSISNLGAQDLARAAIGLERMKQAQVQAFQQSGETGDQYQKFTAQWNKQVDPRVFIWDELPQAKQQAMYNGMTPAQRDTFRTKYSTAVQNGWIGGGQGQ